MIIKEVSQLEFMLSFTFSPASRYLLSLPRKYVLLIAFVGEERVGYAIVEDNEENKHICIIHAEDTQQDNDADVQLLQWIMQSCCIENKKCTVRIVDQKNDDWQKVFDGYELSPMKQSTVVKCEVNEATLACWEKNAEKYMPVINWIEKKLDLVCVDLESISPELNHKITEEARLFFEDKYNPEYILKGGRGEIDKKASMAVFCGDEPVAVALVLATTKEHEIFELLASSKKYMQSGGIMVAWVKALCYMFSTPCKSISYCIYDENSPMLALEKQFIAGIDKQELVQRTFLVSTKAN